MLPNSAARLFQRGLREAAGHAALAAPLRQQFTAKRGSGKKPWWKVW